MDLTKWQVAKKKDYEMWCKLGDLVTYCFVSLLYLDCLSAVIAPKVVYMEPKEIQFVIKPIQNQLQHRTCTVSPSLRRSPGGIRKAPPGFVKAINVFLGLP